jgi:hypothetical protein
MCGTLFGTAQTNAVEFPGAALAAGEGAGLDAALSTTTAKHIFQIISASKH